MRNEPKAPTGARKRPFDPEQKAVPLDRTALDDIISLTEQSKNGSGGYNAAAGRVVTRLKSFQDDPRLGQGELTYGDIYQAIRETVEQKGRSNRPLSTVSTQDSVVETMFGLVMAAAESHRERIGQKDQSGTGRF